MHPTNIPIQKACTAALLTSLLALAACGGGETTTTTTTYVPAPPKPVITVQGSGGDLGKLANTTWTSECGFTVGAVSPPGMVGTAGTIGAGGFTYLYNKFSFGAVAGTAVPGTVTTTTYSDSRCTVRLPIQLQPTQVSFSYVKELAVTSDTPATVQGTADQMRITTTAGASQTFVIGYLPGNAQFLSSSDARFTGSSLTYSK
jgi:hypothetical protein